MVNGALPARLRTLERLDAELTRDAAAAARTAGTGRGLVTLLTGLALWGVVVVAISADLDPVLLAVVALVPLATFELVAGLPTATQELARVRHSAARVQAVLDVPIPVREPEAPRPLPDAPVLRARGPAAPATGKRPFSTASTSTSRPAAVSPWSGRAERASRRSPPCCCASSTTRVR